MVSLRLPPQSDSQRILVAEAQVPFVSDGGGPLVRALIEQLERRGHQVERVALPFSARPTSALLSQAAAWRLLDLSSSNGQPIDLLVATTFPTYFARHPNKVAWLCGDFDDAGDDAGIRQRLLDLNRQMLGECRRVFTSAPITADHLATLNGVHTEVLDLEGAQGTTWDGVVERLLG